MTKEFLASLDPPFTRMLPIGAQQELAEEFNLHPQVVGRILRGQEGSNETVEKVYAAAKAKLADIIDEINGLEKSFAQKAAQI